MRLSEPQRRALIALRNGDTLHRVNGHQWRLSPSGVVVHDSTYHSLVTHRLMTQTGTITAAGVIALTTPTRVDVVQERIEE